MQLKHISLCATLCLAILALCSPCLSAADDPVASPPTESELLAILRSDAADADKAITCKRLAIYGSAEAVPDLSKLLKDERFSSWARIALEAIPGEVADEALLTASKTLEGRLLVGTLNSIGVRRSANAVPLLASRLADQDPDVASAAAVALGRIGSLDASQALRQALAAAPVNVRSAVAEGCVLCAERALAEGRSSQAVEIYDEIRTADVPQPRVIEATRGAILARNQEGLPILIELLQSTDKKLFQLALTVIREFPGDAIDNALAAELPQTAPERGALLIHAMADRKDTVVLAAIMKAAKESSKGVRLAAIEALGQVGNGSCLPALLKSALDADADLAQASITTLASLAGDDVDSQIVGLLAQAEGKGYPLLLGLVGQRRIDAVPELLKAMEHGDPIVRGAALAALGETVSLKRFPVLIEQVVAPRHREDLPAAQQALKAASVRMPDREACAAAIVTALNSTPNVTTKCTLLEILGAVGGTNALAALDAAAMSSESELQDTSTRLLGEWMTEDAAPVLLQLAKNAPGEKFQVRAMRGYIRIARQFVLPEDQRADMCEKAFAAARKTAEKSLVLDVLKRYPSIRSLKLAIQAMQRPELKTEGTEATLVIAQKLGSSGGDVSELLSKAGLSKVKLEIVKAEYGAGNSQVDVTAILRKQVGDLPLITLPSATYNASFGGDPSSGNTKQLKVQYRLNGQPGQATFAENSLIVFPITE